MKPLRQNILESLEELKQSNLESEQARQAIADRIISKRAAEITEALKDVDKNIREFNGILRKNTSVLI